MIDHIGIAVSDYERSKRFYEKALAPLGYKLIIETKGYAGFGLENNGGAIPSVWIHEDKNQVKPGIHIAFTASTRKMVDVFYKEAINAKGVDNGKPGLREIYHPNYYGAFILDPDKYNIEAVCHHSMQCNVTVEKIISDFVNAFDKADYKKIQGLLANNVMSYVTNPEGGVNLLKGRDAFMENINMLDVKSVSPRVDITQLLKINQNQGMVMVEVKAKRKGKTLHNHAAYLINVTNGLISEIRMVEALPAYSDEFWKS